MESVHSLISFVKDGTTSDPYLLLAKHEIGDERLREVAIKVLGWMKSQHRMGKLRPLPLKAHHCWSQELSNLMINHQVFADLLELRDGEVILESSLPEQTHLEICALVDREYKPRLMR